MNYGAVGGEAVAGNNDQYYEEVAYFYFIGGEGGLHDMTLIDYRTF